MGHPSANPILGLLIGGRHVTNKANQLVVCRNFLLGNTASTGGRYVGVVVDKFHSKVPDVVEIERWLRLYSSVAAGYIKVPDLAKLTFTAQSVSTLGWSGRASAPTPVLMTTCK